MKTPEEFMRAIDDMVTSEELAAIKARDAEWRRLVEEAQGERDKERAAHNFAADVLKTVQAERDRLKGELAEARRLLDRRPSLFGGGTYAIDWATQVNAFLVATPMLQAQPTTEGPLCALHGTVACSGLGCIPTADQVQMEAAECDCHMYERTVCDICQGVPGPLRDVNAQVAALAKFVTQLQDECAESGARRATETAALAKRVETIEEWARRQVAEPWFDLEKRPAPPPPEVAGPGHADCDCGLRDSWGTHYSICSSLRK